MSAAGRIEQDEVASALACDAPAAVVKLHMVEPAEQDPAIDVGSASVSLPLVDVMRLTV